MPSTRAIRGGHALPRGPAKPLWANTPITGPGHWPEGVLLPRRCKRPLLTRNCASSEQFVPIKSGTDDRF